MAITLKEINADNFETCIELRVRDDQPYVASNVYSIAQSKVYPEGTIKAIYKDETMVGFLLFGRNDEPKDEHPWLIRFMIDKDHQGKGYGKKALALTLELMEKTYPGEPVYLSTDPKNTNAIKLYEKFGFVSTDRLDEGELVFIKQS